MTTTQPQCDAERAGQSAGAASGVEGPDRPRAVVFISFAVALFAAWGSARIVFAPSFLAPPPSGSLEVTCLTVVVLLSGLFAVQLLRMKASALWLYRGAVVALLSSWVSAIAIHGFPSGWLGVGFALFALVCVLVLAALEGYARELRALGRLR